MYLSLGQHNELPLSGRAGPFARADQMSVVGGQQGGGDQERRVLRRARPNQHLSGGGRIPTDELSEKVRVVGEVWRLAGHVPRVARGADAALTTD
jgi:hypothetical protein